VLAFGFSIALECRFQAVEGGSLVATRLGRRRMEIEEKEVI